VQVLLRDSQAAHLRGDFAGAAIGYRELAALVPSNRWVASKVALMAWHFRKPDEAIRLMAWYLGGYPDDADAWYNFGFFHQALGQTERATGLYQHALTKKPASVEAMSNLALCYMELGRPDDAAVMFDQALTVDATTPEARYNRSFVHLARGNYPAGFADYEARTTTAGFQWSHERSDLFAPDWKGEPLWPGAVLVVYTEQGFGDVIQFARFVPWVRGALGPDVEVRLEVPNELQRLFEQAWPDLDVVARGIPHAPYDAKVSLLSLPAVAGVTLDAVPPPVPFRPDATRFDLTVDGDDRPRVGLSWAGSAMHPQDARRSWPDDVVRALLKSVPGVRWFSLQIGEREDALTDPDMAEGSTFLRAEKSYRDFADTAALITHLDFVVAVDTAVAHLAGSLGVPTMVCVKEPSEWRWLIGRADSPWYPSIRVVRQHVPNDWSGVLDEIAVTLAQFTSLTEAIPA
jgi:tetratricopeptide (TPR) repeat protein